MTQRVVILLAVTFTLTFLTASVCNVAAQAVAVSPLVIPCNEETPPGKPTIKRRAPATEETATANATDRSINTEKCKPENPESVAADQPVTLSFEGLLSTDEAEIRNYIKVQRAERARELIGNASYLESTSQLIKEYLQ
jgi:hypothetical protein